MAKIVYRTKYYARVYLLYPDTDNYIDVEVVSRLKPPTQSSIGGAHPYYQYYQYYEVIVMNINGELKVGEPRHFSNIKQI